jgi:hypothetical protein
MKLTKRSLYRLSIVAVALLSLIGLGVLISGQEAPTQGMGLIDDWTHHRLVFSNPGTAVEALKNGTIEQWYRVTNDPRYQLQVLKRSFTQRAVAAAPDFAAREAILNASSENAGAIIWRPAPAPKQPIKKDWSTSLGAGAAATQTGTFTGAPTAGQTATITYGSNALVLTAGSGTPGTATFSGPPAGNDSTTVGGTAYTWHTLESYCGTTPCIMTSTGATAAQAAENLEAAINYNSAQCGTTAPCFYNITSANGSATAAVLTSDVTSVVNTTSSSITFSKSSSAITLNETSIPAYSGLNACTSSTAGSFLFSSSSTTTSASNLATTIGACNTSYSAVGVTASSSSGQVTVTAATAGTGGNSITLTDNFSNFSPTWSSTHLSGGTTATIQPNVYPAKYGASLTTADCTNDFVVYPTGYAGSGSAANIIAYHNLYTTGCSGTVPSVYWAYNTGTTYAVTTSPIISGTTSTTDTEIAFVQSNGNAAQLVVVRWASGGTLTSPASLNSTTNITSCTVPCYTVTNLAHNDTYSAPFYDFATDDALYVGDDSGNLEKFTGVFHGAISGPTVLSLNTGPYAIASPVYDPTSGCVFVGDTYGYLYSVDSGASKTTSVCKSGSYKLYATSGNLGNSAAGDGIFDAPLVDSTAGTVYVFITDSATIAKTGTCTAGDNCVAEFATSFASGAAPSYVEPLGTGNAGYNLYAGTFDNVYYSSSAPTGNLYALGNTHTAGGATLYRVTITSGAIAGVTSAVTGINSTEYPWPSPLTEFCNYGTSACLSNGTSTTSGTDYLFFSVNYGNKTGCTASAGNGCILSYSVSTTTPAQQGNGLNVTTPGTNGCWATGGLVIDNSASGTTGAQQIYFINLNGAAAGGASGLSYTSSNCTTGAGPTINAVQASQASP